MQGSFNINKLHGDKQNNNELWLPLKHKKIEEKAEKTEEVKKKYEIYKNGCDLVSMDYLKDVILAWYRSGIFIKSPKRF
jgi:hypothetical protein